MTETHPIRKFQIDIDNELAAMKVTPEMQVHWRTSTVGKALILDMQAQILSLYIDLGNSPVSDEFNRGAISILEEYIEWGKPEEEEDGDIQG